MRYLPLLSVILMLGGCSGSGAVAEPPVSDAPIWSREGLEAQPRMEAFERRVPPEMDYNPGTTAWQPAALELEGSEEATTPGALLWQVASALPTSDGLGQELWEQVLRIHQEEDGRATGVILHWGFMDDAVLGHDLRIRMRLQGNGWHVEETEERYHCARGVSDESVCL